MKQFLYTALFSIAFTALTFGLPSTKIEQSDASTLVLLEKNLNYLNRFAAKDCHFHSVPVPVVRYVPKEVMTEFCGSGNASCYKNAQNLIYVERNDLIALRHELYHAIFNFNAVSRVCWEHMVIFQNELHPDE